MKKFNKNSTTIAVAASFVLGLALPLATLAAGPAPVDLLSISTNNFAILSETGITNTASHTSVITGNIGSSPITAAAMNDVFCSEITGTIYGVDSAYVGSGNQSCFAGLGADKTLVDNAVLDMGTAYTDAAGRTLPTATDLGAGNIGGMTLAPGLYKWSTDVSIPTSVTLSGGANDVWIFQIAGNLTIASAGSISAGTKVILTGGAQASNVFWQVGGGTGATLGTFSTFNGTILSAAQIIVQTGAVLHGRALAQTQVTLDANTISTAAAPVTPGPVFIDTNVNGILDPGEQSFNTITAAINAAVAGNTIVVTAGTYTEAVNDTKGVTLQASGTAAIVGQVTLNALGSKIRGFTVHNPGGNFGILINGFGNTEASNNTVTNIGTSATSSNAFGIYFLGKAASNADNIKIQSNIVNTIGSTANSGFSNGGIGVGDSTGNENLTGVVLSGNTISGVTTKNTTFGTGGRGAYGIILNHATHTSLSNLGSTIGAQVTGNTISNLNGLWAHGIGLEGDTPNAVVTGNAISNLTASFDDASAIHFDDNTSSVSVIIQKNIFDTASVMFGVVSTIPTNVDASQNYWNTGTTDPSSKVATSSTGTITVSPWYTDASMTTLEAQTTSNSSTVSSTLTTAVAATTTTAGGMVSEAIPAGIVISGPLEWSGTIALPTATSTFTLTPAIGTVATAISGIEVGAGDIPLTLSQPVKLTFTGLAGKLAGWSQAGVFHQIATTCDSATAPTLAPGTDCKIDVGGDLVVWTEHFTVFITYTQTAPTTATLNVIKLVVNANGGTAIPSNFNVHVENAGVDVAGSPQLGTSTPGTVYTLSLGTYTISEDTSSLSALYTQSFTGNCDVGGNITLVASSSEICTIVNTDVPPPTLVLATLSTAPSSSANFDDLQITVTGLNNRREILVGPSGLVVGDTETSHGFPYPDIDGTYGPSQLGFTPAGDGLYTIISTYQSENGLGSCTPGSTLASCLDMIAQGVGYFKESTFELLAPTASVAPPAAPSGGGGGGFVPLIGIVKVPTPLALPAGPGSITYNYTVWNVGGNQPLTNVTVADDKCSPVVLVSGDTNGNRRLDAGENWHYACTATLSATEMNTAIATGHTGNQIAIATAIATVVVGGTPIPGFPNTGIAPAGLIAPLINIVKVPSRLTPLPPGGGEVTYTYTVTNPGVVPMSNVIVLDDTCGPISGPFGVTNTNGLLNPGDTWVYACATNVPVSTRNIATVEGNGNRITALGYAFATVLVEAPALPNTGSVPIQQVQAQQGNRGSNVTTLQQFLIAQNEGHAAQTLADVGATGYFGPLTRAALVEFQTNAGISPALGNFGPITRAYVSAHYR